MSTQHASQRAFFGISALLFAASTAAMIVWCDSISAVANCGTMALSMWTSPPGESWLSAAPSFLVMWIVMMAAMMLPSLAPMLWRYRQAVGPSRADQLTFLVGAGYFAVWSLIGLIVFVLGTALAEIVMQRPALTDTFSFAAGAVALIAGTLQFTAWKHHHLARCRAASGHRASADDAITAWQHGLRLGVHCSASSAGLTVMLLVIGMMDLRAMAIVTAAITIERLAPSGRHAARAIGAVLLVAGVALLARSLAFV